MEFCPIETSAQQRYRANERCSLYGDSEELVGKWFKRTGKRDQIFLATKFGYVKGSKTLQTDTSAEYTKKACDESLKALGIDAIDLCEYTKRLFKKRFSLLAG
jgi:diketogulonate reductase-like aldo/keto reductase